MTVHYIYFHFKYKFRMKLRLNISYIKLIKRLQFISRYFANFILDVVPIWKNINQSNTFLLIIYSLSEKSFLGGLNEIIML